MRKYLAAIPVLIGAVLIGFYFFLRPPIVVPDHLCEYVTQTLHLECVDVLQATGSMHPGAVTTFRPKSEQQPFGRAQIPQMDLTKESCRIPGTGSAALPGFSEPSEIGLPSFTYDLTGALKEGVEIPLPKLQGATITAGPEFSRVATARITNKKAWTETWDEAAARQAYASCNIKQDCVDLIRSSRYQVISTTAVVDGLAYEFKDADNKRIALSAGGGDQAVAVQNGGQVEMNAGATTSLDATTPFVVGVRFFPEQTFANQPTCTEPIRFAADASAAVTVSGGGGRGNIGGPFTATAALGEAASISKRGSEESECDHGLDLTVSEGRITAQVDSPGPGKLRFSYDYGLSGGHYATVAGCPLGKWIGKTGHDNVTNVSADLVGRIRILVRTSEAPRITVLRPEIMEGSLRVIDPLGEPVLEIKPPPKGETEGPIADTVSAQSTYRLEGPGAFTVEYSTRMNLAQGGAGRDAKSANGLLEVKLD